MNRIIQILLCYKYIGYWKNVQYQHGLLFQFCLLNTSRSTYFYAKCHFFLTVSSSFCCAFPCQMMFWRDAPPPPALSNTLHTPPLLTCIIPPALQPTFWSLAVPPLSLPSLLIFTEIYLRLAAQRFPVKTWLFQIGSLITREQLVPLTLNLFNEPMSSEEHYMWLIFQWSSFGGLSIAQCKPPQKWSGRK